MRHDAIIGGCSGMTRYHLSHVAVYITPLTPRSIPECLDAPRLTGSQPFEWAS